MRVLLEMIARRLLADRVRPLSASGPAIICSLRGESGTLGSRRSGHRAGKNFIRGGLIATHKLEQTVPSPSSKYYDPSFRNIHYQECRAPQLGDAFERK